MFQTIAMCTEDNYLQHTIAPMLTDVGYTLTHDVHACDYILTDQLPFLSIDRPVVFLYENNPPSYLRLSKNRCIFLEKPASIQNIILALKSLDESETRGGKVVTQTPQVNL